MADKKITLGTGAIADGSQEAFTIPSAFYKYGNPVIVIDGLAGAETASLWKYVNGDYEEVTDSSGTQITFTATAAEHSFNGGRSFGLTKDVTAGSIVVRIEDPRG